MSEFSQFLAEKKKVRTKLLRQNPGNKHARAIIVNLIKDKTLHDFIANACSEISVLCIDSIDPTLIEGADGFLSDTGAKNADFDAFLAKGIIPILPAQNEYINKEFNPMKFEGYGYFFVENKPFLVFEKICRLVENLGYPGDRRVLIKNILTKFGEQ